MTPQRASVDMQDLRDRHPLTDVMAAAGIELIPRGSAWMGCCPFHEDRTASMSVDGVPDRFHCFGCGASGDVIDFVQRTRNLDFLDAVAELENGRCVPLGGIAPSHPRLRSVPAPPDFQVTHERAFEINQLAWDHLSKPVAASFARQHLWAHRGLNLRDLQIEAPTPLVGYASHGWTTLTDHLRGEGVTDEELLELDLSMRTRTGGLIDTLRDRLIFPVTNSHGQIRGFVGRDVSGHPHAPKYRNPSRTPVFDKSQLLYRPRHHTLAPTGHAVIVEGAIDAIALAAAAAAAGVSDQIAPMSANGITVSPTQAAAVLAASPQLPRVALDGDDAGRRGTDRWVEAVCLAARRPLLITEMPSGTDPAAWIADHGPAGINAFLRPSESQTAVGPVTHLPGHELVRLVLAKATDPVRDTVGVVAPLLEGLNPQARARFIDQATSEMTRHGWNPRGVFTIALDRELHPTSGAIQEAAFAAGPALL